MKNHTRAYLISSILLVLLFIGNLLYGAVVIPAGDIIKILFGAGTGNSAWSHIVIGSRLPQAVTALLAGASLAVSGLLLQTLFKNPLAGPSILGISDGANLGVALVMLYMGGNVGYLSQWPLGGYLTTVLAAFIGACVVLAIIIFFSRKVSSNVMLLIIGIMMGYIASSAISILNFQASVDKVHQYVMWGMGDFSGVSLGKLPYFSLFSIAGIVFSLLLIKPLNALLLGELYAANLGVKVKSARVAILLCTGLLTATVTAFCGPISFIGLAVPHLARMLLGTSNHRQLVPITLLTGGTVALLCNMLTVFPGVEGILPLNSITSIIGAPVIIYVIVNRKNIQYFN